MSTEYRIYPAIGIARLGNSPDSFFLSPEIPELGPLELNETDTISPVANYKDANHKLRRQAARFRIYAVETDSAGKQTFTEVVAGSNVQIEWSVSLANQKAAAGWFVSQVQPENLQKLRNPDATAADLTIAPSFPSISGIKQTARATAEGKFKGTEVYLGELRTDAQGRLMVLGGRGRSESIPAGQPLGDGSHPTGHPANTFANNWAWFDDVADGPVTATVRIAGEPDIPVAMSAWVIVAPPDFAPYTNGITTLYDIAVQAANLPPPATPSFQDDILPILKAASGLQWVSALPLWTTLSADYATLSTKGNAAADQLRKDTLDLLMLVEGGTLHDFQYTANQKSVLNAWMNGNFVSNYQPTPATKPLTPDNLNRASLTQAVGGGFFPGIEASIRMTSAAMYLAPFRITNAAFSYAGVPQVPAAGLLTRTMACPWQSDFFECEMETPTSAWWPAQRPIDVFIDPASRVQKPWADSIPDHQTLVDKFWMLGIIKKPANADSPLTESERDPAVPHI